MSSASPQARYRLSAIDLKKTDTHAEMLNGQDVLDDSVENSFGSEERVFLQAVAQNGRTKWKLQHLKIIHRAPVVVSQKWPILALSPKSRCKKLQFMD